VIKYYESLLNPEPIMLEYLITSLKISEGVLINCVKMCSFNVRSARQRENPVRKDIVKNLEADWLASL